MSKRGKNSGAFQLSSFLPEIGEKACLRNVVCAAGRMGQQRGASVMQIADSRRLGQRQRPLAVRYAVARTAAAFRTFFPMNTV